jgi:hypothetical protein
VSRAPRKSAKVTDTPALVDTPSPKPAVEGASAGPVDPVVAAGVLPADAPATPSVPDNVPLPPDQMSVAQRPVVAAGFTGTPRDPDAAERAEPLGSVVPEHRSVEELTAPAEPVAAIAEAMVRVPGTVPLPSDQMTPVARATAPLGDFVEPAAIDALTMAQAPEKRLFPVVSEVLHDGAHYLPGGKPVALSFEEWERLHRGLSVQLHWFDGGALPA